jgi:hypothetical protein
METRKGLKNTNVFLPVLSRGTLSLSRRKTANTFYIRCFPVYETALLFERFPDLSRSSFYYERHVYEDEYEALEELQ